MPLEYTWVAKAARMDAVRALLDGGHLILLARDGITRLGDVALELRSGEVLAGILMLNGFPKFCEALGTGAIERAALYGARGELIGHGMTVGTDENADIVASQTEVAFGNLIKIDAAELRHA